MWYCHMTGRRGWEEKGWRVESTPKENHQLIYVCVHVVCEERERGWVGVGVHYQE